MHVVIETPGEPFLKSFFLVTSFLREQLCGQDVLDFYRERGTMETHIGEMKSVVNGRLSSTNRKKTRYAKSEIAEHAEPINPERVDAAALCMHGLALNLLNTFRSLAGASELIDDPPTHYTQRSQDSPLGPLVPKVQPQAAISARNVGPHGSPRTFDAPR